MVNAANNFFQNFHIGTYFLQQNARSEHHVRQLKDCGIDFVIGMDYDRDALDLFQKHGICAVVGGIVPGWFGGTGENAGTMHATNPKEAYIRGIESLEDHPAIVAIDAGDEPSSLDFPYYGEILCLIETLLPNKFPYLNIYPSYGMLASKGSAQAEKELGTCTYHDYLKAYCENVQLPYLSFDHYVFSSDKTRFFSDLSDAAVICRDYNKKLHVVLQVNSHQEDVFLSEQQLCFQAFSALAYGAYAISWACYSAGWWYNHVLDINGNITQQYEKLKNVNRKLWALAEEYRKFRWINTEKLSNHHTATFGEFEEIRSSQEALLGKFETLDGQSAIFYAPSTEFDSSLHFKYRGCKQVSLCADGKKTVILPDASGEYHVHLKEMDACFITTI